MNGHPVCVRPASLVVNGAMPKMVTFDDVGTILLMVVMMLMINGCNYEPAVVMREKNGDLCTDEDALHIKVDKASTTNSCSLYSLPLCFQVRSRGKVGLTGELDGKHLQIFDAATANQKVLL